MFCLLDRLIDDVVPDICVNTFDGRWFDWIVESVGRWNEPMDKGDGQQDGD